MTRRKDAPIGRTNSHRDGRVGSLRKRDVAESLKAAYTVALTRLRSISGVVPPTHPHHAEAYGFVEGIAFARKILDVQEGWDKR